MHTEVAASEFRVEKERIDALLTLSNGDSAPGHFFVSRNSAHTSGPERVGELLNAEAGFSHSKRWMDTGRGPSCTAGGR